MSESRPLVEVMAKHLPPSSASLRLLDANGTAGVILSRLRGDLEIIGSGTEGWHPESADAVVAYDSVLDQAFLQAAISALRPGGRLIMVEPGGAVEEVRVRQLEDAGYTRILVESVGDLGVLLRGEKPHITADTLQRVRQIADQDADLLELSTYKGRYLHLLIRQTPNKPVWALAEDEPVVWDAVTLKIEDAPVILAFSSLSKAVSFMQRAILAGQINGINKVGKFSRETALGWPSGVLLNPSPNVLARCEAGLIAVDPQTAEAPDE